MRVLDTAACLKASEVLPKPPIPKPGPTRIPRQYLKCSHPTRKSYSVGLEKRNCPDFRILNITAMLFNVWKTLAIGSMVARGVARKVVFMNCLGSVRRRKANPCQVGAWSPESSDRRSLITCGQGGSSTERRLLKVATFPSAVRLLRREPDSLFMQLQHQGATSTSVAESGPPRARCCEAVCLDHPGRSTQSFSKLAQTSSLKPDASQETWPV